MLRIVAAALLVTVVALPAPARADGAVLGRVGVLAGNYQQDEMWIDLGCCGNPGQVHEDNNVDATYGLFAGSTLVRGQFSADLAIEYSGYTENESTQRTDALATFGLFVGDHWTLFAGFRSAAFGEGFLSDKGGYTQYGPFLGGGVAGGINERISLAGSLAATALTQRDEDRQINDSLNLWGASLKVQLNFIDTPHSLFLRIQRFTGDQLERGSIDREYTETYANLGYQFSFAYLSW